MKNDKQVSRQRESTKLADLLEIRKILEKKEALSQASAINLTVHFDSDFASVGSEGKPEATVIISTSSGGEKIISRPVSSKEDAQQLIEAVRVDIRRLTRKYNAALEKIFSKHGLKIK